MGTDDIFKKRKESLKQRNSEFKKPKANSYLIVTEGEKTEVLYLEGLKSLIQSKTGGNLEVVHLPEIKISGEGCSTCSLVNETKKLVKKAKIIYQNVWVVFDKDDFEDFDEAIKEAHQNGFHVAWSNQSFEYWLYLHFDYCESALDRHEWNHKLSEQFKKYGLKNGRYEKNYEDLYEILDNIGGVDTAIKKCKKKNV